MRRTTTADSDHVDPGTSSAAVGLSGGVDSSAALWLLHRAGYRVAGVTLGIYCPIEETGPRRRACEAASIDRASRYCELLGVPHHIIDVEDRFHGTVIRDFVAQYRRGRTPNPCIVCNEKIKFPALAEAADRLGLTYIATGHHARIVRGSRGRPSLAVAADARKDQSYFLYRVPVALLQRCLFPVGVMQKAQARRIAARAGIERIAPRESQDVCFLREGDLGAFLDRYIDTVGGEVVDETGHVLGRHRGVWRYTVGQRRGLGISAASPLYVKRIDPRRNRIVLAPEEELFAATVRCRGVKLRSRSVAPPLVAKIRYRHPPAAVADIARGDGVLTVTFEQPQRAPTPGQSLVLYRDGVVIGGGIIDSVDGESA